MTTLKVEKMEITRGEGNKKASSPTVWK